MLSVIDTTLVEQEFNFKNIICLSDTQFLNSEIKNKIEMIFKNFREKYNVI